MVLTGFSSMAAEAVSLRIFHVALAWENTPGCLLYTLGDKGLRWHLLGTQLQDCADYAGWYVIYSPGRACRLRCPLCGHRR